MGIVVLEGGGEEWLRGVGGILRGILAASAEEEEKSEEE